MKVIAFLLFFLFELSKVVLAGPGGFLTLINATPFDWKLTYKHSYQTTWEPADIVAAGLVSPYFTSRSESLLIFSRKLLYSIFGILEP